MRRPGQQETKYENGWQGLEEDSGSRECSRLENWDATELELRVDWRRRKVFEVLGLYHGQIHGGAVEQTEREAAEAVLEDVDWNFCLFRGSRGCP